MAIYSLNMRSIGRTTHAAGTAGAHLRYISRERAEAEILASHMPGSPADARTWMDGHERGARKNARLCDKIRIALPRELDEQQRAQLVRDFMAGLSRDGRVPWFAAIHQTGKDAHNPHAHIVVVDRDIETSKRVLCLSDSTRDRQKKGLPGPSAVEWVRQSWEHHANRALERAGHPERIDRRTLKAQGIDREPTIHIGPQAQHIDVMVQRPVSKVVADPTPRRPDRVIDYPLIDAGRTRRERHAEIVDLNLEREARSPDFETRVWAQFERDQRAKDRPVEAQLIAMARRQTLEERRIKQDAQAKAADVRARQRAESGFVRSWLKERMAPEAAALKVRHAQECAALARDQGRVFARLFTVLDLTGRTRARQDEARKALSTRQAAERRALSADMRGRRSAQQSAVESRYAPELDEIRQERNAKLRALKDRHGEERELADRLLQVRESEREQDRSAIQTQIETWKRMQRGERPKPSETPARSKAGADWQAKDAPPKVETPEDRAEAARERIRRAREAGNRSRTRRMRRDHE